MALAHENIPIPQGDKAREAIDALRGYVYQIYQSALAWLDLEPEALLFLEVAEDYAVVARNALEGVQIKETKKSVTINSDDIIASINSFVDLRQRNPELQVRLRHLTTSRIGKEKSAAHRIGDTPTLETWRKLAKKAGDVEPLRKILEASKLSEETKQYIRELNNTEFREEFLKRIHFECGALDSKFLVPQLRSKLLKLVMERGGLNSQVDGCLNNLLITLLQTATQQKDRFVDKNMLEDLLEKTTHIPVNRAQFETYSRLILNKLMTSVPQETHFAVTRLAEPRPIDEVPLPAARARRTPQIDHIVSALTQYGVSWICGAAGVGKTTGAKIAAGRLGGIWVSINLRGLNAEQGDSVLSIVVDGLTEQKIDGLLIDDLECPFEPNIVDILLYLKVICDRTDLLLLFTSPRSPSPDFLFSANLPASVEQKLGEFSEHDIQEILADLGVVNKRWTKYIHLMSGGGHPQLAVAAIQSMQSNGWDTKELRTLDSLLVGNSKIEQIRTQTRERLLNELPEGSRRLLERLSLKPGSFRRTFVLDMAQVAPEVPDGGIIFDRLIGSWIDQQELDRFSLSPLLSNLATNTLTDAQKQKINFEIANSLTKGDSLDPIEVNSALLAALSGKNAQVIFSLCMAVLRADQNILEMITPHLMIFNFIRTDTFPYEDDLVISLMFRGAQLLILAHEEECPEKIQEILDRFDVEGIRSNNDTLKSFIYLLVYAKLLLATPKFGALPNFWKLIQKLDMLLENQEKHLPPELLKKMRALEMDGVSFIGFLFLNQARQIKLINSLLPAFEFLDSCEPKLREKLLTPYNHLDFDADMLVSGAWLKEHKANTINPSRHSEIFARLEKFAKSWGQINLAVCCRKFRAIILDEYGRDKDQALKVLDEGLALYGKTNSDLVRAKAKVLYRAEDHLGSLELSKILIDGNAPLNEVEKAFLGRDAAISAEKQGDYETARRYYLYGSNAAGNCSGSSMAPMRVGLMADAALASWHNGDHETCLRDFIAVLQGLKDIDPKSSLRAAHCHAICRHVLLWLDQSVTGEKRLLANGEETKIYPGIVSNPEPSPGIGEQYITPIEMAWYMLATIENHSCLNIGLTENLANFLPNGPVLEGQFLLIFAKIEKALTLLDTGLFVEALRDIVAEFVYVKARGGHKNSFNIEKVTYGSFPIPTLEQQTSVSDFTEQLVLCFVLNCIFTERVAGLDQLINILRKGQGFKVRNDFLDSLRGCGLMPDYNTSAATLLAIHRRSIDTKEALSPRQVFELAFLALQIAGLTKNTRAMNKYAFEWLNTKWAFIRKHQRFLLRCPALYDESINQIRFMKGGSWTEKLIDLLQAILPTLGIKNERELSHILNEMSPQKP